MASCFCWVLYRWCDDRPLVYRCLLGMVQTKPQRRRLPTQLTQRPVPVPMSPWYGANQTATPYTTYATTSSCTEVFQYYTTKASETYPQLTPPRATTLTPWSITLPRVTTPPRRPITTWLRMLPGFTTPPRRRSTTWWRMLPILLHRGS
jgi:hypothetical protein